MASALSSQPSASLSILKRKRALSASASVQAACSSCERRIRGRRPGVSQRACVVERPPYCDRCDSPRVDAAHGDPSESTRRHHAWITSQQRWPRQALGVTYPRPCAICTRSIRSLDVRGSFPNSSINNVVLQQRSGRSNVRPLANLVAQSPTYCAHPCTCRPCGT